ncbi:MAG: polysaccharide deacetylase [Chloroflexi bacterium]|nr:polysaccharide deacetylase [Chloroflexota bacterium]
MLRWPDDARVALLVIPNIERFPWDKPRSGGASGPFPDVNNFALRDYGNRVGVWRLGDTLAKHGVRATVALNSDVCRYEPRIIEMGVERQWEWMGHGRTNSESLLGMDEDAERAVIQDVVRTITDAAGTPPRGWLASGRSQNVSTPDLLAEAGFTYLADWSADDQPFPMRVRKGRMICAQGSQVSDRRAFTDYRWPADEFRRQICDQFDQLYKEGAESGRVMSINLHSYLTGQPHRIGSLDAALGYITGHPQVWLATGSEVADWYYEHYYDEAVRLAPFPEVT